MARRVGQDALAGLSDKEIETTMRVLERICRVLEGEAEIEAA